MRRRVRNIAITIFALIFMGFHLTVYAQNVAPSSLSSLKDSSYLFSGGHMAEENGVLYYFEDNTMISDNGKKEKIICREIGNAKNLNITDKYFYFSNEHGIARIKRKDRQPELEYLNSMKPDLLIIDSNENLYALSNGRIYKNFQLYFSFEEAITLFYPTSYGIVFSTGIYPEMTLYTYNEDMVNLKYTSIPRWNIENGWLITVEQNGNYMTDLREFFSDSYQRVPYFLHGAIKIEELLTAKEDRSDLSYIPTSDELNTTEPLPEGSYSYSLSEKAEKIVLRARQLYDFEWTPLENILSYTHSDTGTYFIAGKTYRGVPYGQPVHSGFYVGYDAGVNTFLNSVNNPDSAFYSSRGKNTENASTCPLFSADCSSFVAYAWNLPKRITTTAFAVSSQFTVIGNRISDLQVGYALNKSGSHIILVTDVVYNTRGELIRITTLEETPPIMCELTYGVGGNAGSLSDLQSKIISSGYSIIQYPNHTEIEYKPIASVPLDQETFINTISLPISDTVIDNAACGTAVISNENEFFSVKGYSLHADGIARFEYSVNDGEWLVPDEFYDAQYQYGKTKLWGRYTDRNGFSFNISLNQASASYHIRIRGITSQNHEYEIANFTVESVTPQEAQKQYKLSFFSPKVTDNIFQLPPDSTPVFWEKTISSNLSCDFKIEGWALCTKGVKRYEYSVDDRTWNSLLTEYREAISAQYPEFQESCTYMNFFHGKLDLSYLENGTHTIKIRGVTDDNDVFDIAVFTLTLTQSPVLSTVTLSGDIHAFYHADNSESTDTVENPDPSDSKDNLIEKYIIIAVSVMILLIIIALICLTAKRQKQKSTASCISETSSKDVQNNQQCTTENVSKHDQFENFTPEDSKKQADMQTDTADAMPDTAKLIDNQQNIDDPDKHKKSDSE